MAQVFDEVELPREISKEMTVTPPFGIERSGGGQSGFTHTNIIRDIPIRQYNASFVTSTDDAKYLSVNRFYLGRLGAYPFRFYDWSDHTHADAGGQGQVKLVDGVLRLVKVYADTIRPFSRLIQKPIAPVEFSGLSGTPVLDYTTGIVTGATIISGDHGLWTGEFHVPAQFDDGVSVRYAPRSNGSLTLEWGFTVIEKILDATPVDGGS